MKKVSISVFAILAIVFAVTSAFTTKMNVSKKASTTYELYSIVVDQVATADGNSITPISSNLRTNLVSLTGNDIAQTETFSQWRSSFPIGSQYRNLSTFCDADADHVCVAKFTKVDGTPTTVLEFATGDSKL
jgi:hypothetical protein